jgi:hypothetical protein
MDDQPAWVPAFNDIMSAAELCLRESAHAEGRAIAYEALESQPMVADWQARAVEAREHARVLNRAAAILDWVGRRSDRLHLLTKGDDRGRRR